MFGVSDEKKLIEDFIGCLYRAFFVEKSENEIRLRFPSFEEKYQKKYGEPDKEKVTLTIEKHPVDGVTLREEIRNILLGGYVKHLASCCRYSFSKEGFREEVLKLVSIDDYVIKPTGGIRSDLAMFSSESHGLLLLAEEGYVRSNDIMGVLTRFYSEPKNRAMYEKEKHLFSSLKIHRRKNQ